MAVLVDPSIPINLEFIPSSAAVAKYPPNVDPFHHASTANSHNHHDKHSWGQNVAPNTAEFDALYAQGNNQYMYHLWYTPALAPFMATEVLAIQPFGGEMTQTFMDVIQKILYTGLDTALQSDQGSRLKEMIASILDKALLGPSDQIFVRLGATSAKDSWALNVPTAKPPPLSPDPEAIIRRLLTSGRVVGRVLSLTDKIWPDDPGEVLIIEKWSVEIQLRREFRVFCYQGRVTAVSQDIWWEDLGWRHEHSPGFVEAITLLWSRLKDYLPFDTCTMDVLMTQPASENETWRASLIEFNGFGGHLNTGSDLFHWVNDADILYGRRPGITLRFVCPNESEGSRVVEHQEPAAINEPEEDIPDWLALETKIRATYGQDETGQKPLNMDPKVKLPLRGRWCSAY